MGPQPLFCLPLGPEHWKDLGCISHQLKGTKNCLEVYITVLLYEPTLPHPNHFIASRFLSFSFGDGFPFIRGNAEIFWASSCAPGAGLAKHRVLARRHPEVLERAAGQKCQVTL